LILTLTFPRTDTRHHLFLGFSLLIVLKVPFHGVADGREGCTLLAALGAKTIHAEENAAMPNCSKIEYGLTILAILCLAIVAQAQNPFDTFKQFSATAVMSGMPTHGGQGPGEMKIYRSGDKMRTTMPGGAGYMIMELSQHTGYMVMSTGMCMQMTAQGQQNPFSQAQDATIERSPAGTDTVDGHACKVENLTVTPRNGQPSKMKVWEAEDLKGFPIKIEMQSSHGLVTMEYKDVSFSEPDASLFTHPENCRQMPTMPGGGPSH
jgi:outer membrane lipoprotein-sorting protein